MENQTFPVSDEMILKLKKIIALSKDVKTDTAKKIFIWFINQSENASIPVALPIKNKQIARQIQDSVHDLVSSHCSTRLDIFLKNNDFYMYFYCSGGTFDAKGKFRARRSGCTVWFSVNRNDRNAKKLEPDLQAAYEIDLKQYQ